mmetsp:Transcript_80262/g.194560  ORF Transcript_80262/g.194560 Transcript_80262/m.194560 type:complete len:233 (+) Transcript_80262:1262-1960(+)
MCGLGLVSEGDLLGLQVPRSAHELDALARRQLRVPPLPRRVLALLLLLAQLLELLLAQGFVVAVVVLLLAAGGSLGLCAKDVDVLLALLLDLLRLRLVLRLAPLRRRLRLGLRLGLGSTRGVGRDVRVRGGRGGLALAQGGRAADARFHGAARILAPVVRGVGRDGDAVGRSHGLRCRVDAGRRGRETALLCLCPLHHRLHRLLGRGLLLPCLLRLCVPRSAHELCLLHRIR